MTRSLRTIVWLCAAALVVPSFLVPAAAADPPKKHRAKMERRHDVRHGHNRYYAPHGHGVKALPRHHHRVIVRKSPFYYSQGVFYRPFAAEFVVVGAPIGAVVSILPPRYTTLYIGPVPYYYANFAYYRWDPVVTGYRVVEEPTEVERAELVPNELFVYPRAGQSEEQLATDRYECHAWAVRETGYDPSLGEPLAEAARSEYQRAMTACLEARDYSVR